MHRPNRIPTDHVEPDLPITPMLDMSFQLLSFFIMTFKPTPTEVQIAMALPPAEGSDPNSSAIPDILTDKPTRLIVHVAAIDSGDDVGKIKDITIREEESALEAKAIGASAEHFRNELKSRFNQLNGKPARLTLEIDDKLTEAYVVSLLDNAVVAGFTDISPVPSDSRKR